MKENYIASDDDQIVSASVFDCAFVSKVSRVLSACLCYRNNAEGTNQNTPGYGDRYY